MNRLLITGGSGFLGGHLVRAAQGDFRVFATYHRNKPDHRGPEWLALDLLDVPGLTRLTEDIRPDVIIHCAALSSPDACESDPELAERINVEAVRSLARVSRRRDARLIFLSTDMVFDGSDPPYGEADEPNPVNVYGRTKLRAERAVSTEQPDHAIVRQALLYGRPVTGGSSFSEWMRATWERGGVTRLFSDQFRSLMFGGNAALALLELAASRFTGSLHLGGAEPISRLEFGYLLARRLKVKFDLIEPVTSESLKFKAPRPPDVRLKLDRAERILETALLRCEEGIRRAYAEPSG